MTQAFHPSLPGTLVAAGWDGATRPRRSHWGVNDTSSLRKARVNGPCSGPSAHGHELIFKSISLITRKSVARQIDLEFRIATPSLLYPSPPTFPRAEQSGADTRTARRNIGAPAPRPLQLLTRYRPAQRPRVCFCYGAPWFTQKYALEL